MAIEGRMSRSDRDHRVYESVLQFCGGQLMEVPPRPPKRPFIPPERTRNTFDKRTLRSTHPHGLRARGSLSCQINEPMVHRNSAAKATDETVLPTSSLIPVLTCHAVEPPSRSGVSDDMPATVSGSIREASIHQNDRANATSPGTNRMVTEKLPETPIDGLAASSSPERHDFDPHALPGMRGGASRTSPFSPATDVQIEMIDQPTDETIEGFFSWLGESNHDQPVFGARQPQETMAFSTDAPVNLHGTILIISCPACGIHVPINLSEIATRPIHETSGNNNPYLTGGLEATDYHQRFNGSSIPPSQSHSVIIEPEISFNHHSGRPFITSTPSMTSLSSGPQPPRLPSLDPRYFEQDISATSPSASSTLSGDTSAVPYGSAPYDDGFLYGYTYYDAQ